MFTTAPPLAHAVSIICKKDGRFLLIRRSNASYRHWYAFPGGKIEPGEMPEQAAKRELMEETALQADSLNYLKSFNLGKSKKYPEGYFLLIFRAFHTKGIAKAGDDASDIRWCDITDIEHMHIVPIARKMIYELNSEKDSE